MKIAVAKRPVEQFDTQLKLPEWQLEPDDEALSGDPESYFYSDEQGNLVDPHKDNGSGPGGVPPEMYENGAPPAAAGDDFLNQATGLTPGDPPANRPVRTPQGEQRPRPRPTPLGE
jgi:penicillin-binding protein 1A